ncbi:MAG: MotA/TolQ/ExbB proton channel family protein [Polyangiales bacterium]
MDPEKTVQLDPIALLIHASRPVKITVAILLVMSLMVWVIGVLKLLQLGRMRAQQRDFEDRAIRMAHADELFDLAATHRGVAGSRVIARLTVPAGRGSTERLRAIADRAIVGERQRAGSLLSPLASIASSSPFIGLFGTVYGIMDAFVRIGAAKSASLPVVAPAIGEALITTAIGLACAIPAVIFYNAIDKRLNDFVAELESAAGEWVLVIAETQSVPVQRGGSNRPAAMGAGY